MQNNYRIVIKKENSFFNFNFAEVFRYKDLVWLLVKKYYSLKYKQTLLGPLWLIIYPFITILLNTFIFGTVAALSTDGVPKILFYIASNTIWSYFAESLTNNANTFLGNANLFGKVYFPRIIVPISNVIITFFEFCIQLSIMIGFMAIYYLKGFNFALNANLLYLPIILLQLGFLSIGVGVFISAITIKYRDLGILVKFIVQIWLYASPVVYSLSIVPEKLKSLYMLNPVTPAICMFRYSFFGTGEFPIKYFAISLCVTFFVSIFGVLLFNRVEKNFMDTI